MTDAPRGEFFAGIDPGLSGGIALMTHEGGIHPEQVWKMPRTEKELADLFCFNLMGQTRFAVIERVHSMPKQGVSSTFKFGMNYGFLRALLIAFSIPFEDVPSQTWQRYMHCLTHGDKAVSRGKAQTLFPALSLTNATAEAVLMAKFCREKHLGLLPPPIKIVRQAKPDPNQVRVPFPNQEELDDF